MAARIKVECYIDGFNVYHAIDRMRRPEFKWVDYRKLMEKFVDPNRQELVAVYYFSAFATWLPGPYSRHQRFVEALKATGTTPVMGHFKEKDRSCRTCGSRWVAHEEKETDVNIALRLLNHAHKGKYDEAFVVSQDSDLLPAIRMVRDEFPRKAIKVIAPPGLRHSKELGHLLGSKKLASIKQVHLERCLLPKTVVDQDSKLPAATRPDAYDPPA